jgi:hypothetical protein
MQVTLQFTEQDFKDLKSFEKAVQKQLGSNVYVGTDSLCLYFDYPKELKSMLRPFPDKQQLQFTLNSSKPTQ